MSTLLIYALFVVAGIAAGGAYSMYKVNKIFAGVLAAIAVLAVAGGILRLIG
ncbi:hypothetical protein [Rhodococcus sp. HNM0569]|uniref:hypothetical protein n=1 Tax=Rhodococcus sp. HNM0569 TaxID=2716340 RepID=UPI00146C0DCD|nr:hypothetical protein [Rhodococcus sp. HNM0569]NLU82971.1 hypothetical protein [Rhodococcus sp. HNM0569]